ncbi:LysR family transcriptional regulator [Hominifimenecus sp. rT4P-3]|uniref:LysR family transcriptional regulator n=1 Tax=Hominifimenecus sp. rT4P-3 TaxID=3242979 RepID=UPI003DA59C7B
MNLQQLSYFHKIAQLKNYTKASQELSVTQSNLSHSMAKLEEELGVPLFVKDGRNIEVTAHGKKFDAHVSVILQELELAQNEIQHAANPTEGKIRLAVSHTLHYHFLPNLMREYKEIPKYRKVQFQVLDMEATAIGIKKIEAGEVDLGFGAKIDKPGYRYFEVMREELTAVVPANHPFAQRENLTLKELCQETLITYNSQCGTRMDLERIFQLYGVWPRQISEVQNEKMIASMVAAGMGVSVMPWIPEINVYQVASVPLEHSTLKRSLYMFWREEEFRLPVVEQFRKFVMNTVKAKKNM